MPNVAVITGSNGLIGQATCRKLTQSGFLAVGVDIGASKAAVINMTRSLGKRLGRHDIRVNAIAPGLIKTAMGARVPEVSRQRALGSALGRAGEPEEIASVVDFLASDAASFVTCTTIEVNGGA